MQDAIGLAERNERRRRLRLVGPPRCEKSRGEGASPDARLAAGQYHVPRPPTRVFAIVAPQRGHGQPSRPYTRNSFCIAPCEPSGMR